MYPLLETIKVENGRFCNLPLHQERFNRSRAEISDAGNIISLGEVLSVPGNCKQGVWKCRFVYGKTIGKIAFVPYVPKDVNTLKIVRDDHISYGHKFANRSQLEKLLSLKGACDDILIVKQGMLTDTSFSNIAFFDGSDWITPDTPLLKGTKQMLLLSTGKIKQAPLRPEDLKHFQKFCLINAMLDFNSGSGVPVENICLAE